MSESVNTTLVENCENDELEEKCEKNAEKDWVVAEDKFVMSDPVSAYLSSISKYKVLSREEEHDLMVRVKAGDKQAREEMILHNLKLVVSIAKKYTSSERSMDMMDLIQEGNLGLQRAIQMFDEESGNKFSTYATWWIKQGITRSLTDKERMIRLPVHIGDKIRAINTAYAKLSGENQDVTPEDVDAYLKKPRGYTRSIMSQDIKSISYDKPVNTEDGEMTTLGDFIPDSGKDIEKDVVTDSCNEYLRTVLQDKLSPREYEVIKMRFGFYGQGVMTLEEVGKEFGVTRERVRQIEAKALEKLGKGNTGRCLRELL